MKLWGLFISGLILIFSSAAVAFQNSSSPIEVIVHLNDGRQIEGTLVERDDEKIVLETDFGEITIKMENVDRVELKVGATSRQSETSPSQTNPKNEPQKQETQPPFVPPANQMNTGDVSYSQVMLYESRKKKIGTAIGFEALGAGLLYAEKYGAGTAMLVAQTGLIVGSVFVEDSDVQLGMAIGAVALKATNLGLTISAVNKYNQNLMFDMGLQQRTELVGQTPSPRNKPTRPFDLPTGATYLNIGGTYAGAAFTPEIRYNENIAFSVSIGKELREFNGLRENGPFDYSIMSHYLVGNRRNKFEIGIGISMLRYNFSSLISFYDYSYDTGEQYTEYETKTVEHTFLLNPLIGYRFETRDYLLIRFFITNFDYKNVSEPSLYTNTRTERFNGEIDEVYITGHSMDKTFNLGYPIIGMSFGYSF